MLFALGYLAGIVTCAFIATVLILLRKPLVQIATPIVKALEVSGPRARGFIVEPITDAQEARSKKIRENAEKGADTPISDLM